MSTRTGLPDVEVALLRAVADVGTDDGPTTTDRLLQDLDRRGTLGPRAASRTVFDLLAPWRRHLPLLVGDGNWGSRAGDPPADPVATTIGLSAFGRLAVAAENGAVGPVPFGLVDGDWYRGGRQPPFDPGDVVAALRRRDPAGLAVRSPTGGGVSGDLDTLVAGAPTRLALSATAEPRRGRRRPEPEPPPVPDGHTGGWFAYGGTWSDPGGHRVVVAELPYGVDTDAAVRALTARVSTEDGQPRHRRYGPESERHDTAPLAPVVEVADDSSGRDGVRVIAYVRPRARLAEALTWVLSTRPLTVEVDAVLPAPLEILIRGWEAGDGSGLDALATCLGG